MKITETQKEILTTVDAKTPWTASELAEEFNSKAGPMARAANSLIEKGLLRAKTDRDDITSYTRTAEGGKIAKTLN